MGKRENNKLLPSVCGIGIVGIGPYTSKNRDLYNLWINLLHRCYDQKVHVRYPSYASCTLSNRWLIFQNFAKDVQLMPNWNRVGFHLDKDLRVIGNKKYSKRTCSFVPREINTLLADQHYGKQSLRACICQRHNKYKVSVTIKGKWTHIGTALTRKDAFELYCRTKLKIAKDLMKVYKGCLHRDVIHNLRTIDEWIICDALWNTLEQSSRDK